MHALVICHGELPGKGLAQRLARNVDVIVAADGGANVARKLGIHPDVIIGDLDSITTVTKRFFAKRKPLSARLTVPIMAGGKPLAGFPFLSYPRSEERGYTQFIRVTRQDNTDLEKALDVLLKHKCTRATIIAATGKRLDHTLGNLSVMWNYTTRIEIEIVGEGFVALPIRQKKVIAAKKGTTVSLVPFGACSGITLRGLFYPLTNAAMRVGEIGVSNVVKASPFTVEVKKGRMLMIVLADHSSLKVLS
jgi:thiamine pyrophosphokinase